jgi:hypothetical protein
LATSARAPSPRTLAAVMIAAAQEPVEVEVAA